MRIQKWVSFEHEVTVDITAEDIAQSLYESDDILVVLNNVAGVLKGVKDDMIAKMSAGQREMVREFLTVQAARY